MARTRGVCRSWHSIGVSVEVAGIGVAKHGGMVTVDAKQLLEEIDRHELG